MDIFAQIATKIIEQQEQVIGPVAIQQAQAVEGIVVDWEKDHTVMVDQQHAAELIDRLVGQYEALFGPIARETSKEAALKFAAQLPPDQIPTSLR